MMNLQGVINHYWYPRQPLSWAHPFLLGMLPFSLAYRTIVSARNKLYDRGVYKQAKLPCPVISIGNITAGGAGKTPLTILTANGLQTRGFRPAVLSRGYGGRRKTSGNIVADGADILLDHEEAGEEPVLIARSCPGIPVLTGPDRYVSGKAAIEKFGADVLVLDDAFQHRRLFRDVDIVLIAQTQPFGNGCLLPAGPLREAPAAIQRADVIVKTGNISREVNREKASSPSRIPIFQARYQPRAIIAGKDDQALPITTLPGKEILAFAGIATPDKFRATLEELGGRIVKFLAFPDHYFYKQRDVQTILQEAQTAKAQMLITTEKDAVKLQGYSDFYRLLHILRVTFQLSPSEETFFDELTDRIKR